MPQSELLTTGVQLFLLDQSEETLACAHPLQAKFGLPNGEAKSFADKDCFSGMSVADFQATAWLGHSHGTGIGDFTVAKFVKKFTKQFNAIAGNNHKDQVQHIYLIGCETGLRDHKNDSLAQQVVEGLYEQGFKNVRVHAVANMQASPQPPKAMRVKVVNHAGIGQKEIGDVEGFLFDKKIEESLIVLEKKYQVVCEAIKAKLVENRAGYKGNVAQAIKDRNALMATLKAQRAAAKTELDEFIIKHNVKPFFTSKDIRNDLLAPQYTFTPKAIKLDQQPNPMPRESDEPNKLQVLETIQKLISEKEAALKKEKSKHEAHHAGVLEILTRLHRAIADSKESDWILLVKVAMQEMDTIKDGPSEEEGFKQKLKKGFKKANRLVKNNFLSDTYATLGEILRVNHVKTDRLLKNLVGVVKDVVARYVPVGPLLPRKPKQMPEVLQADVQALEDYKTLLESEVKARYFQFFHSKTKVNKIVKVSQLIKDMKQNFIESRDQDYTSTQEPTEAFMVNWKKPIQKALEDKKLIEGRKRHYAKNVLNNINNGEPEKFIAPPKKTYESQHQRAMRGILYRMTQRGA